MVCLPLIPYIRASRGINDVAFSSGACRFPSYLLPKIQIPIPIPNSNSIPISKPDTAKPKPLLIQILVHLSIHPKYMSIRTIPLTSSALRRLASAGKYRHVDGARNVPLRTLSCCLIHTGSADVVTSVAYLMSRVIDALALQISNLSAEETGMLGYTQLDRHLMMRVIDELALSSSNLSADKPGRFRYT